MDDGILIQPVSTPRKGWKEAFEKGAKSDDGIDDDWIDVPLTDDDGDWEW
ncbi:MAG: hypothetical protein AB7E04_06110 [Desulfobacteraceae bacterium]